MLKRRGTGGVWSVVLSVQSARAGGGCACGQRQQTCLAPLGALFTAFVHNMAEATNNVQIVSKQQYPGCTPEQVFERWLEVVWRGGGGMGKPTIEEPGDSDTYAGCRRRVAMGIREEILSTRHGEQVEYAVVSGPFPVSSHHATVDFEEAPDAQTGTVVTWTCDVTPYFGLGWVVRKTIEHAFASMLTHLKKDLAPTD
eukprot:m.348376 g.348376  ORF g.348376 m.348376 type:complete len:198 (-) comp19877_c0_seq5:85-678(-)